ncbi:Patellin-3 [Ancistrocladus abbreviatus]
MVEGEKTAVHNVEEVLAKTTDVSEVEEKPITAEQEPSVLVTDSEVNENKPADVEEGKEAPEMESKAAAEAEEEAVDDAEIPKPAGDGTLVQTEVTKTVDLPEHERKALDELKQLIQVALINHDFSTLTTPQPPQTVEDLGAVASSEREEMDKQPSGDSTKPDGEVDAECAKDLDEKETISETVTKITAVDEDGAKTVEAIEETIVSVTPSLPQDQPPPPPPAEPQSPEEVSIWGIPLLKDERSDVVLWKFLRARDFKVKDAFIMIKNTIKWRKEFKIDELIEDGEELGDVEDFGKVVFMHGFSKEGHPVCYNVYGAFQDKGLYGKAFSDEEKREKFLRWRIQFLEKSIRKLDFRPGGISTIVQVNDLKNSPGPGKWELRQATKQALQLLQDNYPEFVAKQVFVNVPLWYVVLNKMISPFLTQRTKSKFVVAGPSRSAETLFSYIAAEQVPVQYGGLSSKDGEFSNEDAATQIIIKPGSKETVEFSVNEACQLTWEVRVLGWEVSYGAEFVPNAQDAYIVIIQKIRKVAASEESIISNSFKVTEPGKVVLSLDNATSKKKKLLYRLKSKPLL